MSKQQDAPADDDGALLESVPEHIKNPDGHLDEDGAGTDAAEAPDAGTPARRGLLSRLRRGPGAGEGSRGARPPRWVASARGAVGTAGRRIRSAYPASTSGRVMLWGGTAVVVAGAVVLGVVLHAHQRDALLRAAPGGVLTLDAPAHESWHVDLGDAVEPRVVPVGELAAVTAGGTVLGLDPATGEERWSVEVLDARETADGGRLRCGPSPRAIGSVAVRTPAPSDPLVCVTEGVTPAEVVVIGTDGRSETRTLDVGSAADDAPAVLAPLSAGALAVLARDDAPIDLGTARAVADSDGIAVIKGRIASAPGLTIRVEDAASGDVRWERTVEFDPGATDTSCLVWGDDEPRIEVLGDLTWSAGTRAITAEACGVSAHLATSDGEPVPDAEPQVRRHEPWATTDPELTQAPAGVVDDATDVLVRTADVVVVLLANGTVAAHDAESGARLWTSDVLGDDAAAVAGSAVFGAYTDGRSAMLVLDGVSTGGDGQLRLVALDLATGGTTWDESQDEPYSQVAAVDGHLVQITGTGVAGLGTAAD